MFHPFVTRDIAREMQREHLERAAKRRLVREVESAHAIRRRVRFAAALRTRRLGEQETGNAVPAPHPSA